MTPQECIDNINAATTYTQVVDASVSGDYKKIVLLIHPDKCKLDGAVEAFQRLGELKDVYENGKELKDDIGTLRTNEWWVEWKGTEEALLWSVENYKLFKALNDNPDREDFYRKYIPSTLFTIKAKDVYRYMFRDRSLSMTNLVLTEEHVRWVLNRLLEYAAYLEDIGFAHCGLTPESVFITPKDHGIQVCSWYHLTRLGNRIGTISGAFSHWYPTDVFSTKTADASIDVEMCKKIAIYLLGDQSGAGIKLRGSVDEKFLTFVQKHHDSAITAMHEYKALLKQHFESRFYILNI